MLVSLKLELSGCVSVSEHTHACHTSLCFSPVGRRVLRYTEILCSELEYLREQDYISVLRLFTRMQHRVVRHRHMHL